jgi:hypothetical protein
MGVYVVTLPEGAYTTLNGSKARVVVADNSTDAVAIAGRASAADGAPWASATAVLVTGSTDFSRITFGFVITHDADNGFGADKVVSYTPLPTDAPADIGAGLVAAALAAGLTGTTHNTTSGANKVVLAAGLNVGKSVITIDGVTSSGESVASALNGYIGGNDFPDVTLTGTSIKPTVDAASGSAATARNIDLAPLTSGINPTVVGELVGGY